MGLAQKQNHVWFCSLLALHQKRPFLLFLLLFLNYTTIKRLFLQIRVCQTGNDIIRRLHGWFLGFPSSHRLMYEQILEALTLIFNLSLCVTTYIRRLHISFLCMVGFSLNKSWVYVPSSKKFCSH